ncbi:transmembrane and ubiquitin-like domain-containing protein 1 [Mercenaria mercenaria]|uniref:transmembrane and ubiquitin-like domain-containing protein 1 n=1 Tax=Mercenaria mercenaria TaxID=6596 RepID=UPI00234EC2E9|nr:transmembrane and ubiquitin-like domain-containing protein 1 [Mercenaria mercenaria]
MPWIEGIGDEVTIGVSVLLGLCILFVAWLSTGIREIPFISVIIVQLTRRREVQTENSNTNSNTENVESVNNSSGDNAENADQGEATQSTSETVVDSSKDTAGRTEVEKENTREKSEPVASGSVSDLGTYITETGEVQKDSKQTNNETDNTDLDTVDNIEQETDASNEAVSAEFEPEICPVSNTELRERRINFFSSQTPGKVPCDNQSLNQSEEKCPESDRTNSESKPSSDVKPKSLSKLASDLLSEPLLSNNSPSNDSVSVNSEPADTSINRDSAEQSGSQSETGSGLQDPGLEPGEIRVRIKFLNDTQRLVTALATETIGNFRRRHFSMELSQSKLVRFIFNGQDLRNDSSTLQSYNIGDNSVLHCLVTQPPAEQHAGNHGDDEGLDIGVFMFPLFGLLLGIVWYMRFMYRQFFNVTSTLTLGGITFLFLAAFMSYVRGQRNHEHID